MPNHLITLSDHGEVGLNDNGRLKENGWCVTTVDNHQIDLQNGFLSLIPMMTLGILSIGCEVKFLPKKLASSNEHKAAKVGRSKRRQLE